MNAVLLLIIGIPLIEIYLMIKIGSMIGAFNTIFLIFFTAITGVYFARLAGLNAIRSGFNQLIKNEIPIYEIISGATLAFAALLLIIPGFLTDLIGFFLIFPITRKILIKAVSSKFRKENNDNDAKMQDMIGKIKYYQEDNLRLSNEVVILSNKLENTKQQLKQFENNKAKLMLQMQNLNNIISENNIRKLKLLYTNGFGGIRIFKKKPAFKRPVFLKNNFFFNKFLER